MSINFSLMPSAAVPSTSVNPASTNGLPIEIAGLHVLLNDEVFAKEIVPMVRPTTYTAYAIQSTVTCKCDCCVRGSIAVLNRQGLKALVVTMKKLH